MNKIAFIVITITFSSCINTKKVVTVNHSNLPEPIGPYSHSTNYGDFIFTSGQIGIDPKTNILKEGIKEQTIQIFENLKIILSDNHSDLNHITKITIFITDIKQFDIVNEIYASYFKTFYPARSTIQVVALPKNASIEIECTAVKRK
ncbi:Rid family detoxifying hydrolase [uncultured Flavobacterium sp.]|uniref:Rid family detoxifying hydrolase n=1 Tax=uncultured Flavobacterium sp. TaxID=165435 RepID=UPI00292DEE83|nr:Rid family detoxifying hydrolase [uncultured Flavobacterium sp.]